MNTNDKRNETPQQAAERVSREGGKRDEVNKAYDDRRKELGLKVDLPD